MSDTDTNDSKGRATGTEASDTKRIGVQYGLLGPCVALFLFEGEGEGHELEPAAKSAVSNSAPKKLRGVKRYVRWHKSFTGPLISVQNLKAKRHEKRTHWRRAFNPWGISFQLRRVPQGRFRSPLDDASNVSFVDAVMKAIGQNDDWFGSIVRANFKDDALDLDFVAYAWVGVGVGHYAALSDLCSETHDEAGMPNCRSITAASSGLGRARPL